MLELHSALKSQTKYNLREVALISSKVESTFFEKFSNGEGPKGTRPGK